MAGKNDFWEAYRRPEWQRKRLEIMQRDDFACCDCGTKDNTLNVHHSYYEKGKNPWEYEDASLRTLCEKCHNIRHRILRDIQKIVGQVELVKLLRFIGYAFGIYLENGDGNRVEGLNIHMIDGITDYFKIDDENIRFKILEKTLLDDGDNTISANDIHKFIEQFSIAVGSKEESAA